MTRVLVGSMVLVTACLIGCGGDSSKPDLFAVDGVVNFKGAPVEGATVTFSSAAAPRSATGMTDSSGNFRLTSYDTNDGAIVGEHMITISKSASAGAASGVMTQENAKEMMSKNIGMMSGGKMSEMKPESVLPVKYADAKTSGEKRTVSATEGNSFKFELTE